MIKNELGFGFRYDSILSWEEAMGLNPVEEILWDLGFNEKIINRGI